jgi:hypothetical protein
VFFSYNGFFIERRRGESTGEYSVRWGRPFEIHNVVVGLTARPSNSNLFNNKLVWF